MGGLALGKTLTIGVVAQAIDSPFYGEGLRGIEACLRHRGYAPLFMSGNWADNAISVTGNWSNGAPVTANWTRAR